MKFIKYSIAKQLKQKGFDDYCLSYYEKDLLFHVRDHFMKYKDIHPKFVLRPTYDQVVRFFRENHGLYLSVNPYTLEIGNKKVIFNFTIRSYGEQYIDDDSIFSDYYDALDKAIEEAIKCVPNSGIMV